MANNLTDKEDGKTNAVTVLKSKMYLLEHLLHLFSIIGV